MKKICVYCGASSGKKPEYVEGAKQLAREIARRGMGMVYGGASIGIMGEIADTVLEAGGEVIGIIPKTLESKELAHYGLTKLHVVDSMHDRKAMMAELSDAFIALPGGLGTMEELFEVWTWAQLGFHQKPCGLLNVSKYYDQLISFLNHSMEEQFMQPNHRSMLLIDKDPVSLLDQIAAYQAPDIAKWIETESQT